MERVQSHLQKISVYVNNSNNNDFLRFPLLRLFPDYLHACKNAKRVC